MSRPETEWKVRSAIRDLEESDRDLVSAHTDHLERTRRLFQVVFAILAAMVAAGTVVVQTRVAPQPLVIAFATVGAGSLAGSSRLCLVAYVSLPADASLRFGEMPGPRIRMALDASMDRVDWLHENVVGLARRVEDDSEVVGSLLRRRMRALAFLGIGATAVAVAALLVLGGELLA